MQLSLQTLVRGRRERVDGWDPGGPNQLANRGVMGQGRSLVVETACCPDPGQAESILRAGSVVGMRSGSLLH